jgi:hypothetical protein
MFLLYFSVTERQHFYAAPIQASNRKLAQFRQIVRVRYDGMVHVTGNQIDVSTFNSGSDVFAFNMQCMSTFPEILKV